MTMKFSKLEMMLSKLNQIDPTYRLDELRRQMVEAVVKEYTTSMRRDLNVEVKKVQKMLSESAQTMDIHRISQQDIQI